MPLVTPTSAHPRALWILGALLLALTLRETGQLDFHAGFSLVPISTTTISINRAFVVTRNNQRILEGIATWHTHLTAYGLLSARSYAKLATPTDKDFRDAIAKELCPPA